MHLYVHRAVYKPKQGNKLNVHQQMKTDMLHIYNGMLLSHKKNEKNAICSNMDGQRVSNL